MCAGFRPGSILPRVVPFTISLEQVHKLHVICPAPAQAWPWTSIAPAAKLHVYREAMACIDFGSRQCPAISFRRHVQHLWTFKPSPFQSSRCRQAQLLGVLPAGSAAALLAMAAAHLCCSLLLPTQPTPLVKNSKQSVPRGAAMCLHTCLQGNQADQQLIAWVHALV